MHEGMSRCRRSQRGFPAMERRAEPATKGRRTVGFAVDPCRWSVLRFARGDMKKTV